MSDWRVAPALRKLLLQVNAKYPGRSKASDGTIGNEEHSARKSDHNPNADGVVCALDITHDPLHGLDSEKLAEAIRKSQDPRVSYIISNRKIANPDVKNWAWRPYSGANPHNHHCHISVKGGHWAEDTSEWNLGGVEKVAAPVNYTPPPVTLSYGRTGEKVKELQKLLKIDEDGVFGRKTRAAVQQFQKSHGLVNDGIVGPATWDVLLKGTEK